MKRAVVFSFAVLLITMLVARESHAGWIVNNSFETQTTIPGFQPSTAGVWQGDASEIVLAQNGVTPLDGERMFAFRGCYGIPGYGGVNGGVWQLIELDTIADYIDGGNVTATLSASLNRASNALNGRVDMRVSAYSRLVSTYPSQYQDNGVGSLATSAVSLTADRNPSSWQFLTTSLVLPKEADFLAVEFIAWNDARLSYPAFTGLYVDATSLNITPVPAPSSLVTLVGVGVMVIGIEWWKKRRRRVRSY